MTARSIVSLYPDTPEAGKGRLAVPQAGDTYQFDRQINPGTLTTDVTVLDLAATWNNAGVTFTGIKLDVTDTASNAASLLMDLQVGSTTQFSVAKNGNCTVKGLTSSASISNSYYYCNHTGATNTRGVKVGAGNSFSFTGGAAGDASDLFLLRDAANTLALRNSTNAQTVRIYNTYTDASNYERAALKWATNRLVIDTEEAGTGTARGITVGAGDLQFSSLPTSDPSVAGQLYTQTATQLGGSGTTPVVCVSA